jgi:hypothetical protein
MTWLCLCYLALVALAIVLVGWFSLYIVELLNRPNRQEAQPPALHVSTPRVALPPGLYSLGSQTMYQSEVAELAEARSRAEDALRYARQGEQAEKRRQRNELMLYFAETALEHFKRRFERADIAQRTKLLCREEIAPLQNIGNPETVALAVAIIACPPEYWDSEEHHQFHQFLVELLTPEGESPPPKPQDRWLGERVWIVAHRRAHGGTPKVCKATSANQDAEVFYPALEDARAAAFSLNQAVLQEYRHPSQEKIYPHVDETGYGVFPVDLEVLPEEKEASA